MTSELEVESHASETGEQLHHQQSTVGGGGLVAALPGCLAQLDGERVGQGGVRETTRV